MKPAELVQASYSPYLSLPFFVFPGDDELSLTQ
jgi:hypothetical protein